MLIYHSSSSFRIGGALPEQGQWSGDYQSESPGTTALVGRKS